jgi:surface protein
MGSRASDDHERQYVHSSPFPRSGLFLAFYFPSFLFLCGSTNSIFEQCNPSFFFQPLFILGLFSCCCCGAVFNNADAFNGDISKWQVEEVTTMEASTYTLSLPLQDRVFVLAAFVSLLLLSVAALILFLNNTLSSCFSPTHLYILGHFFVAVWYSV